jgi:hypothetical protein
MRRKILLAFLTAAISGFSAFPLIASDPFHVRRSGMAQAFPTLARKQFEICQFLYEPGLAEIVGKKRGHFPKDHLLYTSEAPPSEDLVVAKVRLKADEPRRYYLVFTEGPSADYAFYLMDEKTGDQTEEAPGEHLALPGDGFLYLWNRSDSTFPKRRLFAMREGKLAETHQPFFYVGLQTKTLAPVTLYQSEGFKEAVTTLPAGAPVEVLLAHFGDEFQHDVPYLVRTRFGLVGWVRVPVAQMKSDLIEGLYYAGD